MNRRCSLLTFPANVHGRHHSATPNQRCRFRARPQPLIRIPDEVGLLQVVTSTRSRAPGRSSVAPLAAARHKRADSPVQPHLDARAVLRSEDTSSDRTTPIRRHRSALSDTVQVSLASPLRSVVRACAVKDALSHRSSNADRRERLSTQTPAHKTGLLPRATGITILPKATPSSVSAWVACNERVAVNRAQPLGAASVSWSTAPLRPRTPLPAPPRMGSPVPLPESVQRSPQARRPW